MRLFFGAGYRIYFAEDGDPVVVLMSGGDKSTQERDATLIDTLKNPQEARAYLEVAIEEFEADGDKEHFLVALRNVTEAQGGIGALALRTNLNREHLYRVLSKNGNPRLDKIAAILQGLGFRLSVELIPPAG
jgi:probable addiction module antidote protein